MIDITGLLKSTWGAEKWILEGWNQINDDEKQQIKNRMDDLFKNGLPFELKKDKLFYIHTFSFLAQLEVLAIQVPLKFESKMSNPIFKQRMRTQLLDELFHGLIFTKIVYLLCEPYASPPPYNENIEQFCDFIRKEDCPQIAVVLLNLIAEGWIEELFHAFRKQNIANTVFDVILEDEHRHVCEADLYCEIGLPDTKVVIPKLEHMEELLFTNICLQYKYMMSLRALLGKQGIRDYFECSNKKYIHQLNKIGLTPGRKWLMLIQARDILFQYLDKYTSSHHKIDLTPMRKIFMNMWSEPRDPTMVSQFNVNISCLDIFNKKFPQETLTMLMLQAISQSLHHHGMLQFLVHRELYQSQQAYVSLVVKLPNCHDHFGSIVFSNANIATPQALFFETRQIVKLMAYCYKKREELDTRYPHLKQISDKAYAEFSQSVYPHPEMANASVSLTNLGGLGYTHVKSPLLKNEALKFTLLDVERKQVWNKKTNTFEIQDLLPVSVSADHRVADGNVSVAKMVQGSFEIMFQKLQKSSQRPPKEKFIYKQIINIIDNLFVDELSNDTLMIIYGILSYLQTSWPAFIPIQELFEMIKEPVHMQHLKNILNEKENA